MNKIRFGVALALLLCIAQPASIAQDKFGGFGGKGLPGMGAPVIGDPIQFEATYTISDDRTKGKLSIHAKIADGYHTYSTTQPPGGPYATSFKLDGKGAEIGGEFEPNHEPEIGYDEVAYGSLKLEEFYEEVTWSAPLTFEADFAPDKSELVVLADALVCRDACMPVFAKVKAKYQPAATSPAGEPAEDESLIPSGSQITSKPVTSDWVRIDNTHAKWSASLSNSEFSPGETYNLTLSVANDDEYHVYQYVPGDEDTSFRTMIVLSEKSGMKFGTPTVDSKAEPYPGFDDVFYHGGQVNWQIPVGIPSTLKPGEYPFEVRVAFATCNDRSCDPPAGLRINGVVSVGSSAASTKLTLSEDKNGAIQELDNLASWIDKDVRLADATLASLTGPAMAISEEATAPPTTRSGSPITRSGPPGTADSSDIAVDSEMPPSPESDLAANETTGDETTAEEPAQGLTLFHVLAGLVGGFILNFMPCVLPVIGLKVMSFMNQAGSSHRQVVTLNLAYTGGILAVMLTLALLTVGAKLIWGNAFGWGQQFTILEFKVALACLVFAMALSFLGLWEIPIPGFATSSKSGELMEKEGPLGAFFKGVLTTILATPCSGPLLGSLFGLSLVLSPLSVILLYLIVGIGMALPFLVLCVWPGFLKYMPKPGAWMETLKQILAFPLIFTAIFFVASISDGYRIATLMLLVVVWFACWLIGRVPAYADKSVIRRTWLTGVVTVALGAVVSFGFFGPFDSEIDWQPYDEAQLVEYRKEGKTVMLDFTANWCLNCKINTRVAIDRKQVAELIDEYDIVPMIADWTDKSDTIRTKLEELNSNSIPLLAIYPPEPDADPILLRDLVSQTQVLEALKEAGPSESSFRFTSFSEE